MTDQPIHIDTKLVVGKPHTDRTIEISPTIGIRVRQTDGSVIHLPPAGGMHVDADPEVCREDPFVVALAEVTNEAEPWLDPAAAYRVACWLYGTGNEQLQKFLDGGRS